MDFPVEHRLLGSPIRVEVAAVAALVVPEALDHQRWVALVALVLLRPLRVHRSLMPVAAAGV